MKILIHYLVSIIIFFPIILFTITYFIARKRKKSKLKSFGMASDVTTIVLFFSVPLSISSLWDKNYNILIFIIAIIIAIIFTYIDWRTKKEIEVLRLIKKTWRLYFILLTIAFVAIWIVGLIQSIIEYAFS
ncbi:DUF3397 family protein [Lysinibacillus sp. SGAir0095]|uniref:DUF3397 family protein n=1 Tax=Lysinibacillus sp. SGAir0095 TaxID=2070463 RepID=UPI0010CD4509|nr:DUF3397 family protein [Lysinibacillus sp. SGAir0095]QCR31702.1 DUF3397 domain-containing protein [Lysinibacillus sp. SGAir0095]